MLHDELALSDLTQALGWPGDPDTLAVWLDEESASFEAVWHSSAPYASRLAMLRDPGYSPEDRKAALEFLALTLRVHWRLLYARSPEDTPLPPGMKPAKASVDEDAMHALTALKMGKATARALLKGTRGTTEEKVRAALKRLGTPV